MNFGSSSSVVLIALSIFLLRVVDMSMDTLRVLFVVRGKKLLSWSRGFIQSAVFIIAISSVLANEKSLLTILAYAGGFATGNVVGMYIEEWLAIGHLHLTVVSPARGAAVAEALREKGFGVTEISARGLNGTVNLLHVDVVRKRMDEVERIVKNTDKEAYVTVEDVRPINRGHYRA
ncbi:MAG TPA: DUF5698 domain-containing protein [Bellilinea sp.]|nr:DUF5698 domain-containing protein [Bellilinea sp.]